MTDNRRHHSDATGLSGCRPLRHDLKIWRVLPRRRAKFVTVRRQNGAGPSCTARLAPHGRGLGFARRPPRGPARRGGLRGATARPVRRADGPAGGKALAPCRGRPNDPVSGMIPPGPPHKLEFHSPRAIQVSSCVSGRGMRCTMTAPTAGISIAEGGDASAWKGADGACRRNCPRYGPRFFWCWR